jgi:hypothetical protein
MSIFNIHLWHHQHEPWFDSNKIFDEISIRKPSVINFIAFEDFYFNFEVMNEDKNFIFNELTEFCFNRNITTNYCFGIAEKLPNYYSNHSKNAFLYIDPVFHFRWAYREYHHNLYKTIHSNFKYSIMCLTSLPRFHRCFLIDELQRRDLIKNNAIAFKAPEDIPFEFNYWKNDRILKLPSEEDFVRDTSVWIPPVEWQQSFLHIVSETNTEIVFVTEKTCEPILGAKLFVCQAAQGFHQNLRKLGFQLYDEIIDYSFDNIEDYQTRTVAMLDAVQPILDSKNKLEIYNMLYEKLRYNQLHAIKLALSKPKDDIPKSVVDYYNQLFSFY